MAANNGLTPAVINIQPQGLLGFLGVKNGGQNPQQLASQALVPVIDLLEHYFQTNSVQVVGNAALTTFTGAAATNFINLGPTTPDLGVTPVRVPSDEWWALLSWSVRWVFIGGVGAPAQSADASFSVESPTGVPHIFTGQLSGLVSVAAAVADAKAGARSWDGLYMCPPGSLLRMELYDLVGATAGFPIGFNVIFRVARLRS